MATFLRRTTLTRFCPEEYQMQEGIPIFTNEAIKAYRNPKLAYLLEHEQSVLTCFGKSDVKLNKEIKNFAMALNDARQPLTEKWEKDLTEWNRLLSEAKEIRHRAVQKMDFAAILKGAVTLKRYTLYLSTQISELMTEP